MALKPYRRYDAGEKALILEAIAQAQSYSKEPLVAILGQLQVPRATYYRWKARQGAGTLADRAVLPQRQAVPPTPAEVATVRAFALEHPAMGYKRLAWLMVDKDIAYLRPYQVYRILIEEGLLYRCGRPEPEVLNRPPEPDHPDQVWHVDLMYVYIRPRWYYLVDILDGYSRFLVHWSLNLTMLADTVTLTVQEALDRLSWRLPGKPKIVHDRGSQFVSGEWRAFVETAGVTDIVTRVAHPESNGRIERLHRTHRQEGLTEDQLTDYYRALAEMERWGCYYNYERPHGALNYLCPADYYRGDPAGRLAERERKLAQATAARAAYWSQANVVKGQEDPSQN